MFTKEEVREVLEKNKKILARELKESKELLHLLQRYTTAKLKEEEKDRLKHLLIDLFKKIPALAIFALPGGFILLPIAAKLIPEILPSSFHEDSET